MRMHRCLAIICFLAASTASAQLNLESVTPDKAPFNRPTEVVLEGNFIFEEGDQVLVQLSATETPAPETDPHLWVQVVTVRSIVACTPRVDQPAEMFIYVRKGDLVSETLPVSMTGNAMSSLRAVASALLDEFEDVDADDTGTITFEEAAVLIADLTAAEFDALDANGDGEITEAEVATTCSCVPPRGFWFSIVTLLAFLWEALQQLIGLA